MSRKSPLCELKRRYKSGEVVLRQDGNQSQVAAKYRKSRQCYAYGS